MRTPVCFRIGVSLCPTYPHIHYPFNLQIQAGVGERYEGKRVAYTGQLNASSIRHQLQTIREMSMSHWAYLLLNGERVDDCDISNALSKIWH